MTQNQLKTQLQTFIDKLPLTAPEKERLTGLLNGDDGINKVKLELQSVLSLARETLQATLDRRKKTLQSAQEAFDEAEAEFIKAASEIEQEAKDLAKAISDKQDEEALEEARKKVA